MAGELRVFSYMWAGSVVDGGIWISVASVNSASFALYSIPTTYTHENEITTADITEPST